MKFIPIYLLLSLLLLSNCTTPPEQSPVDTIIGRGQLPNAAKDGLGNIYLVFGSGDSLLYAFSKDRGRSFSASLLVKVLPGLVAAAMRGPQIAVTAYGTAIIACNKAGNIFAYTMAAGSSTWSKAFKVNDEDTVAKEGFLALGADADNAFAVWLDLRGDKHNKIMGARSADGGKTWSENMLVYASPDSTVCQCCKPSVAVKGKSVYIMFRNWLNGNRDMYLIRSADGGNSFGEAKKLGIGSWALNGCPMDGGALTLNNGNPQAVWRRKEKVFACTPSKPEREIGEGNNCTIESVDGKNIYAWVEKGEIIVAGPGNEKKVLGKGSLPVIRAVDKGHVLCVWQHDMQVHTALVAL